METFVLDVMLIECGKCDVWVTKEADIFVKSAIIVQSLKSESRQKSLLTKSKATSLRSFVMFSNCIHLYNKAL